MTPFSDLIQSADLLSPLLGSTWLGIPQAWVPLAIFALRFTDTTLSTLRLLVVVRGRKAMAWALGFTQSLIFVTAISGVFAYLRNPLSILAFAAGMACGNLAGIAIESSLAPGHSLLRILSPARGEAIIQELRSQGHGVTELPGHGMLGTVSMILCNVPRRRIKEAKRLIMAADPKAFITSENVRELRGGWRS
ncbi:MAG: DUF5698 domain-containing protein [Anaerolineales bacterium]|jgi:uncharacterized protein YebE (UPF0316 family)